MGGTAADGSYLGMYALLTAEQKTGYRPRILAVPELETGAVISMLCVIAEKLRAFVYSGCGDSKTLSEASMFRDAFSSRELMLIWPNFIAYNPLSGKNEEFPAAAYACGLRALIDNNQGWHKSLSNVAVKNVLGISRDVSWSLQDEDSSEQALVRAFNAIRRIKTPGGIMTYDADRARGISHGDIAWANMLAIINEPIGRENGGGGGGFAMEW